MTYQPADPPPPADTRGLRVEVNGVDVTEHVVSVDVGGQTFVRVDLAAVRDCDGYPGLTYAVGGMTTDEANRVNGLGDHSPTSWADADAIRAEVTARGVELPALRSSVGPCSCVELDGPPCCGDPGDCSGCGS